MCYHRRYTTTPFKCVRITPNSTDNIDGFNGLEFAQGISITITHSVDGNGQFHYQQPTRNESVTFNYTY